MLLGMDISNHNGRAIEQTGFDLAAVAEIGFVIMKASEGTTFKDPFLDTFYDRLHGSRDGRPDDGKQYGFYHYARPELGHGALAEADFFLQFVKHHKGHCIFALDVEGEALKWPAVDMWAAQWCTRVHSETGCTPFLYTSEAYAPDFPITRGAGYRLWCASWRGSTRWPDPAGWHADIWQNGVIGFDLDRFDGTRDDWHRLCRG